MQIETLFYFNLIFLLICVSLKIKNTSPAHVLLPLWHSNVKVTYAYFLCKHFTIYFLIKFFTIYDQCFKKLSVSHPGKY